MQVLGVPVSTIDLPGAVATVVALAQRQGASTVFVRDVPSLMLAVDDPALLALHHRADLVVPDGSPLVWIGRRRGMSEIGRVAGADLVEGVCRASLETGQRHYFYGGRPGVAKEMARRLARRHAGLVVAGVFCPPMREIDANFEFDVDGEAELEVIRRLRPDFIWVGVSSPKQEWWISRAAPRLGRGVLLGVGAAFDFHAGTVRRAPRWMRDNGLEWLHRLLSDPRRLWRRYLVLGPRFVIRLLFERWWR